MAGFIKLSRDILSWEWYNDPNTFRVFFHLMMNACFEDKKYRGFIVKRGSLVMGRAQIAQELGISEQSVRTALNHLKSTSEITIKTTNKYSIVTICNFDTWQGTSLLTNQQINQQINQQSTNNQPTTNQQLTTIEEGKEIKERKETINDSSISFPAKDELLRVSAEFEAQIAALKVQIEELKKPKTRAKPIPKSLGGHARKVFEDFYLRKMGVEYVWSAKDAKHMDLLLKTIRSSRENRATPLPCEDADMIGALQAYLEYSERNQWVMEHLMVSNLYSQYNVITGNSTGTPSVFDTTNNYRYPTDENGNKVKPNFTIL